MKQRRLVMPVRAHGHVDVIRAGGRSRNVIRAGGRSRNSAECCVGGIGDGLGGVSVAPTKINAA